MPTFILNNKLTVWIVLAVFAALFLAIHLEVIPFLWLVGGLVVGLGLLFFDQYWLYSFYREPEDEGLPPNYITRSFLFLVAYIAISIFLLTSSGSVSGMGIIIGLGAGLVSEMWPLRFQPAEFQKKYLSQFKEPLPVRQIQLVFGCFVLFVALLALSVLL